MRPLRGLTVARGMLRRTFAASPESELHVTAVTYGGERPRSGKAFRCPEKVKRHVMDFSRQPLSESSSTPSLHAPTINIMNGNKAI